jgi:hypothetical protein
MFNKKLADEICTRIAAGESLRTVCQSDDMPSVSTIMRWLLDMKHEQFWEQYAHARASQAELMFDELLEIADDGSNDLMLKRFGNTQRRVNAATAVGNFGRTSMTDAKGHCPGCFFGWAVSR